MSDDAEFASGLVEVVDVRRLAGRGAPRFVAELLVTIGDVEHRIGPIVVRARPSGDPEAWMLTTQPCAMVRLPSDLEAPIAQFVMMQAKRAIVSALAWETGVA